MSNRLIIGMDGLGTKTRVMVKERPDAAVQLAKTIGIKLIEREELINMISQLDENQTVATMQETIKNVSVEFCPKCGSEIVLPRGNRGEFYGCSGFPKCRYTKNVG